MIKLLEKKIRLHESDESKDLPDAIPSEPIEISTEADVNADIKNNAAQMMINDCIQAKWGEINNLKSLVATFESEQPKSYKEINEILNQLIDDETIAVGMLSKAYELIDNTSNELMQQGIDKAEETLADAEYPIDESLDNKKTSEFTTIEDAFKDVTGLDSIFDDNGHFLPDIYENHAQEVADKYFGGNIDKLDKVCDEESCF